MAVAVGPVVELDAVGLIQLEVDESARLHVASGAEMT